MTTLSPSTAHRLYSIYVAGSQVSACKGALLCCRMRLSTTSSWRPQLKGLHSRRLAFRTRWWIAQTGEKPSNPPPMQRSLRCAGLLTLPHSLYCPPSRILNTRQVTDIFCAQTVAAVQDYRWMFAQSPDSLDESGAVYHWRPKMHMKPPSSCSPCKQGTRSMTRLERCRVPGWRDACQPDVLGRGHAAHVGQLRQRLQVDPGQTGRLVGRRRRRAAGPPRGERGLELLILTTCPALCFARRVQIKQWYDCPRDSVIKSTEL